MSNKAKYLSFCLLMAVVIFFPTEVWAEDNIFVVIRSKAGNALVDSRKLVYVLGGFGLIGFAFMAVFNKISWKWFANIAIGLFLVSVAGMLIAYFTGDETIADELEYGFEDKRLENNTGGTSEEDTPCISSSACDSVCPSDSSGVCSGGKCSCAPRGSK